MGPGKPWVAFSESIAVSDLIRIAHLCEEHFVAKTERCDGGVTRQRHGGHRLSVRADQHGALSEWRQPMIAITHVELCVFETEAQHGTAWSRTAVVGDATEVDERIGNRLPVRLSRNFPFAV